MDFLRISHTGVHPGQHPQSTWFQDRLSTRDGIVNAAMEVVCPGNPVKAAHRLDTAKQNRNLSVHHRNDLSILDSNFERAQANLSSCKPLLEDIYKRDAIIAQFIFKWSDLKIMFGVC